MTATITSTEVDACGATTMTAAGRIFVCNAKPHPTTPSRHYFSLDTEATLDAAPSNAHLESNVESTFRLEVRKLGGAAIKLVPTIKGLPDRLVIMPGGRVYFVELKTKDGSPSAAQRLWRDRLKKLGCDVTILYGAQEVKTWIAEITEAAGPQFRKSRYDD